MKSRFLFAIVVTFAATACSGVKNLMPPQLDLPEELAGNSVDSATLADVEWWKMYPDSSLVHIIRETIDHNRDLAAAAARVEQMRQLYGVAKANFFPILSANAAADRETNDYYGEGHKNDPEVDLKATLSWEADLWGSLPYLCICLLLCW